MNWDALGAMGEIAGAIAVIATLFFLARQLQVNTRELERNNEYQKTTSIVTSNEIYNEVWRPIMLDPELAEIYLKGSTGKPLTDTEAIRYCTFLNTLLAYLEAAMETPSDLFWSSFEGAEIRQAGFEQFNPLLERLFAHPTARIWLDTDAPYLFTKNFMDIFHEYGPLKSSKLA